MVAELCSFVFSVDENDRTQSFHAFHGPTLRLGVGERGARRQHSFSGVCFSARPLRPRRPFMVRIDEVEYGWTGHLRLGVTSLDPASHPDLSSRWVRTCAGRIRCRHFMEHTSLVAFPQVHSAHTRVGDLVGVYFEPVGADWIRIHLLANGLDICPEQEPLHVPAGAEQPLFVVLDVFGMTRKVTVMPMVRSGECTAFCFVN